ncbi:MAG: hypothetical protein ACUVRD_01585 [Bacteroidia bacterium]
MWVLSCKKGTRLPNLPPETRIFVDTIALEGSTSLPSKFQLFWYGEDSDGYVAGYELRFGQQNWTFTARSESTFTFPLPPDSIYFSVEFQVRAVDNQGEVDPTPARLRVPLRNSPPVATFSPEISLPDTTFPVLSFKVNVSDPDGDNTLQKLELKINDGDWHELPLGRELFTLAARTPQAALSEASVYVESSETPLTFSIPGLRLDQENVLYLRAQDQGGLYSQVDTSRAIFLRKTKGPWLVIDHTNSDNPFQTLRPALEAAFTEGYDVWNLRRDFQPPLVNPTWRHIFRLYEKLIWLAEPNTLSAVENAEEALQRFFFYGGKAVFNFLLRADLTPSSPLCRILPIDSIPSSPQNALLAPNDNLQPTGSFPVLQNAQSYYLSSIQPVYIKSTARVLYQVPNLLQSNGTPWPATRPKDVGVTLPDGTKFKIIFLGIPLWQLSSGSSPSLADFFIAVKNSL